MNSITIHIFILFISVFISAFSQILLKKAALKSHKTVIQEYMNALVITAYGIYFIAVILDLIALRKVPISYIPIIEASNYIFIIAFSKIFLGEKLSKRKIIALLVILAGITIFLV